jgi:hypothetical protein
MAEFKGNRQLWGTNASSIQEEEEFSSRYYYTYGRKLLKLQDARILDYCCAGPDGHIDQLVEFKSLKDPSLRRTPERQADLRLPLTLHKFVHARDIFYATNIPTTFVFRWRPDPPGEYYFFHAFPEKNFYNASFVESQRELVLMIPFDKFEKVELRDAS